MWEHPSTSSSDGLPAPEPAAGGSKARRRFRRASIVLVFGAVLVAVAAFLHRSSGEGEEPRADAPPPADLRRDAAASLLSGKFFYVVLDPEARSLRLMLKGAFLEEYPVEEIRVGSPRVLFRPSKGSDDWSFRVWSDGRLDPPRVQKRIEFTPPDSALALDSLQPALPIPPTAEEAYRVPPVYRIRYQEGLTLVVESSADSTGQGTFSRKEIVRSRAEERLRALRASLSNEGPRVLLRMKAENAQRFYRSLPGESFFLVTPPRPAPAEPRSSGNR
jgi:hypothetical protein